MGITNLLGRLSVTPSPPFHPPIALVRDSYLPAVLLLVRGDGVSMDGPGLERKHATEY